MLASAISSSLIQPLFGPWSDRRGALWLLPAGVASPGSGSRSPPTRRRTGSCSCSSCVSGLGVAAYHPEGSKFAAYASGAKRASGMSLFSVGGNLGYALGPTARRRSCWHSACRAACCSRCRARIALVLLLVPPFLQSFAPEAGHGAAASGEDRPGALALLLGVIGFRSVAWFGLLTFVPLWEVSLGHSKAYGTHLLSLMLLAGAVGTLAAGPLADRLGRRPVLLASLIASAPLILVFVLVGGVPGAIALAFVGVCVIGTFGVTMVMAQEYLPRRIGMASGLSIGLSIGLGGIAAVALGAIADSIDLQAALYAAAAAPLVALALAALLPSTRRRAGSRPSPSCNLAADGAERVLRDPRDARRPGQGAGLTAYYLFDIDGAGKWKVDVDDGKVTVTEGGGDADTTISASDETFERIVSGEQNPTTAYMTGKLKVKGDMGQAMKLQKLF